VIASRVHVRGAHALYWQLEFARFHGNFDKVDSSFTTVNFDNRQFYEIDGFLSPILKYDHLWCKRSILLETL